MPRPFVGPSGRFTYSELGGTGSQTWRVKLTSTSVSGRERGLEFYMDRSQDVDTVAAYAVLRSGAAYVPLDVASPVARLSTIISSCGIELALCDPAMTEKALAIYRLKKAIDVTGQVTCSTWVRSHHPG